ncbi:MAG: N-6 DNA methylase [Planctomycetes bacterium]|nr:N-6 DNA methylase [Planctomycetota bacterium]
MADDAEPRQCRCPQSVVDLVARFRLHADAYHRQEYNETQVRREFIDPMFQALGWDIDNTAGHAEAYKDVIHEDAIKVGGTTKAPDYCFRIGGVRKFFVEAKKPSVSLSDDPGPAYQLRRYAWSNKLALSIVTDFEEFAVYDCRVRPKPEDKPSTARILYLRHADYPERWNEVAAIFSKEAILQGSFDKYAESNRRKRGTAAVDDEFLKEIEGWRDELARNIALRNPGLSVRELNYAVGKTIDRIVFLRMCEDRGVETYEQLRMLPGSPGIYSRLVGLFRRADERYNSGLFHFEPEATRVEPPDELTPDLTIDDAVLKAIIKGLYYPVCPYEFSVMPPEILGQVYEQFLGKVITLSTGHRAKVEYKPEVKKAGGVYYTPRYIVDYLVRHTVGKLLDRAGKPGRVEKLAVLDAACGSGSFLLGAYQCLLDWHLRWYCENDPKAWAKKRTPPVFDSGSRGWQLTVAEKKRLLVNNIFGVDIDPQAVEVTKLALLLRVLEGETQETLDHQLKLFRERALPDLGRNIKCGNSLIGLDFYDEHQFELFDEEDRIRINAFDWNAEFPRIMGRGGFDAVIGNPPYGGDLSSPEQEYLSRRWESFAAHSDSYIAFLDAGLSLCRRDGYLGMIVPSALLGGPMYRIARRKLLTNALWEHTILLPYDVFRDAYIDTCIICLRRGKAPQRDHTVRTYEFPKRASITDLRDLEYARIRQTEWLSDPEHRIMLDPEARRLLSTLENRCGATFGEVVEVRRGILPGADSLSIRPTKRHRDIYFEGDIYRYVIRFGPKRFVAFDQSLRERPRDRKWFDRPRILLRRLVSRKFRLMACATEDVFITNKNLYSILPRDGQSLPFILGVLNSGLISYLYVKQVTQATKDDFAQVTIKDLCSLPFPGGARGPRAERVEEFVRRMLDLHGRLAVARTPDEQTGIGRQIDATDRRIDELVYELYGLSEAEIARVDEATRRG